MGKLKELLWVYRFWRITKITKGMDYGQFLSVVGFYIACGKLPQDTLKRFGFSDDNLAEGRE